MATLATATMRSLGARWVAAIGSAELSGIVGDAAHQTDPGKHLSWNDNVRLFGTGAWPLRQVAGDRNPPNKTAAAAIDIKMNAVDMKRVHNRFIAVFNARARDPRARFVTAFNGYNGTGTAQRFDMQTGGISWTDDSHNWHEHVEVPYDQVDSVRMVDAVMSIVAGETLEAYAARTGTTTSTGGEDASGEEEVHMIPIQLPRGFAFDEKGGLLAREYAISVPVEPAGHAGNPIVGTKKLYLSFSSDFNDKPIPVRVAIWNGAGWTVTTLQVKKDGRNDVAVPPVKGPSAYNVSVGRVRPMATTDAAEATYPLSVLVTVA